MTDVEHAVTTFLINV